MFIVCNDKPSNIQFSVGSKRARKREREQKLCLILYLLWRFFSKVKSICLWHQIVRSTYFFFFFSSCQAYTIQNPHTQQTADRKPMKIYFWERWKTINGNSLVNGSVWVGGEALRVNTILKRLFAPLLDHFSLLLVLNKKMKMQTTTTTTTTTEAVVHIIIIIIVISLTCILCVCAFLLTCSYTQKPCYKLISSVKAKRPLKLYILYKSKN